MSGACHEHGSGKARPNAEHQWIWVGLGMIFETFWGRLREVFGPISKNRKFESSELKN